MPQGEDETALLDIGVRLTLELNGDKGQFAKAREPKIYESLGNGEEVRPAGVYAVKITTSYSEGRRYLVVDNRNARGSEEYQNRMAQTLDKVLGKIKDQNSE